MVTQKSSVKIFAPVKENNGAPLIEDWESNEEDEVESPLEKERKTVEPSADKVEVEIPKQDDKPARRPVKYSEMYRTQRPRVPKAMSTRTGLKPVNSVRHVNPKRNFQKKAAYNNRNFFKKVNTAKEKVNIARPNSAILNAVRANRSKAEIYPISPTLMSLMEGMLHLGDELKVVRLLEKEQSKLMCDKKNNVLFIYTECFVMSRDFKLADESHVLLKVPRKNNMYSVDIKNIVPKKDLTCLVAKATNDKSMLWHRRLGDGPKWLFDIDTLAESMNYVPVIADHSLDNVIGDILSGVQTRRMIVTTNEQGFISAIYEEKTHEDLHTCLFACFLSQEESKRITNALKYPAWVEAMQEELLQFYLQQVWTLVDLPRGKKDIEGIDYDEVFTPVARIKAIRLFLAYASFMGFFVYQMDVKSAFLYGRIKEEVYVCQPLGFEDLGYPDKVYKVEKALYGLHQDLRAWYETLAKYLLDNGFRKGKIDQTLFIKRQKENILLVQVYIDDIIFGSTKKELCTEFEELTHHKFQMSSMGELTFFLGLQVKHNSNGIFISQDKYVDEILRKLKYEDVKAASTPMDKEKALLKDSNSDDVDVHLYRLTFTGEAHHIWLSLILDKKMIKYALSNGLTPTLSFMRPFGCPVTIINIIDHLEKFNGKADEGTKPVKDYILLPLWSVDPLFSQDLKSSHDDGSKPSSDNGKKVDEDPRKENECNDQEKEDNVNSTNNVNTISSTVNAAGTNKDNELPFDPNMPALEDVNTFNFSSDDEDDGTMADMNNLDIIIQVSPIPTTRIHKDHLLDQVIGDLQTSIQTRKMSKNLEEHEFIEEEVYVCQPLGFEDSDFPDRVYKVKKALYGLHQASRAWFTKVKTSSTPMETQKPLLKNEDGEEVYVHMYRSMIGLLMYLTPSRLDIMFAVCACARYQVNLKVLHLYAVKEI
nr:putative ribonuclease H-like domain-containing protein [Tanacetum cinerariifolium]